mmetsp:Transcript_19252/g.37477  ORF Transcript_19252/g.37477 Transcript_19252/m.37477 type:complete len:261 (-) Transcript_19252:155-937(-)
MGGRDHAFLSSILALISTSPLSAYSVSPGNFRILHTSSEFSGSYLALPAAVVVVHLEVLGGTGMRMMMFRPVTELNCALTLMLISRRVRPSSLTIGCTLKGRLMFSLTRYFISTNSPSGGIKVTARSLSNFPSFTHWWKLTSSISMAPEPLLLFFLPSPSIISLSFNPNLHSGIPHRYVFITTSPETSLRKIVPLDDMSRLTCSTTSKNTSFFRYLIPSLRHDTAPVTCGAIDVATLNLAASMSCPSCMMRVLRRSALQF